MRAKRRSSAATFSAMRASIASLFSTPLNVISTGVFA
jgi:hypothetical protein